MESYREISKTFEVEISHLFTMSMDKREDSRAFGAMIEKIIGQNWLKICEKFNFTYFAPPGRRTLYDMSCEIQGNHFGFDVKTKDLDKEKYSDGGVCSVDNLLKYMLDKKGSFMIIEIGHKKSSSNQKKREVKYVKVVPFHYLPENVYRIENLGTGQVRLNQSVEEVYDCVAWDRSHKDFFDIFSACAINHYHKVIETTHARIKTMEKFRENEYKSFKSR